MNSQATSQAILYGAALGDALGWPVEFLPLRTIKAKYGPDGIQEPPNPAQITDDTQMTLALNEALIEAGGADIESLMAVTSQHFIKWNNSPDNNRAPGHTVVEAIRTLEAGAPWNQTGLATAKGCGSAMRVSGIGFLYQQDPQRLREVAHHSGLITHGHPIADAAAVAAAYLVKLALDGVEPHNFVNETVRFVGDISDEFNDALSLIQPVEGWVNEELAIENLGKGWTGEEAITIAIYCCMRYPDDYAGAVRRAANIPGDSDSVACITGGIMGARVGLGGIPEEWIALLENLDYLTDVANRLADRHDAMYSSD